MRLRKLIGTGLKAISEAAALAAFFLVGEDETPAIQHTKPTDGDPMHMGPVTLSPEAQRMIADGERVSPAHPRVPARKEAPQPLHGSYEWRVAQGKG